MPVLRAGVCDAEFQPVGNVSRSAGSAKFLCPAESGERHPPVRDYRNFGHRDLFLRSYLCGGGTSGIILYEFGGSARHGERARGNGGGAGSPLRAEGAGADHKGAKDHVGVRDGGVHLDISFGLYRIIAAAGMGPAGIYDL